MGRPHIHCRRPLLGRLAPFFPPPIDRAASPDSRLSVRSLVPVLGIPAMPGTAYPLLECSQCGFRHSRTLCVHRPSAVSRTSGGPREGSGAVSPVSRIVPGSRGSDRIPSPPGGVPQADPLRPPTAPGERIEPGTQGKERPALPRISKSAFAPSQPVPGTRRIRQGAPSVPGPRYSVLLPLRGTEASHNSGHRDVSPVSRGTRVGRARSCALALGTPEDPSPRPAVRLLPPVYPRPHSGCESGSARAARVPRMATRVAR
jgi:hypothetical protein